MKLRLISIFLLIFLSFLDSKAQLVDELPKDESGKLYYTEVVQMNDTESGELYLRAFIIIVIYALENHLKTSAKTKNHLINQKGILNISKTLRSYCPEITIFE